MRKIYKALGLMSGTSVDGLDIAYCEFSFEKAWSFTLKFAETFPYDSIWKERLTRITETPADELAWIDIELGKLFGSYARSFIDKHNLKPDLIASHGHTVFHQPARGFTMQIGSGYEIMKACKTIVVNDFRSLDVSLGGQGAPLVPVGDEKLFHEYDFCLNLGGICNVSFDLNGKRVAFDIAACNIVLNKLAQELGAEYDPAGQFSREGKIDERMLEYLNDLNYYKMPFPKSLGIEYIREKIFPIIDGFKIPGRDKLATYAHHLALQIDLTVKSYLPSERSARLLVTGGGAHNLRLLELLKDMSGGNYTVETPDANLINFKEALIFAFLGVLRIRNETNVYSSVTGAVSDSCSGIIYDHLIL